MKICPLRFGIRKDDLTCYVLLISILIDTINFRIERTATVKVSVFVFGGLIGVKFGAEQLHFEPTAGVELRKGSRLRGTSLNSSSSNTTCQMKKCNLKKALKKFEMHEKCDCIRKANEGFVKKTSLTS